MDFEISTIYVLEGSVQYPELIINRRRYDMIKDIKEDRSGRRPGTAIRVIRGSVTAKELIQYRNEWKERKDGTVPDIFGKHVPIFVEAGIYYFDIDMDELRRLTNRYFGDVKRKLRSFDYRETLEKKIRKSRLTTKKAMDDLYKEGFFLEDKFKKEIKKVKGKRMFGQTRAFNELFSRFPGSMRYFKKYNKSKLRELRGIARRRNLNPGKSPKAVILMMLTFDDAVKNSNMNLFDIDSMYFLNNEEPMDLVSCIDEVTDNNIGEGNCLLRFLKAKPGLHACDKWFSDKPLNIESLKQLFIEKKRPLTIWNFAGDKYHSNDFRTNTYPRLHCLVFNNHIYGVTKPNRKKLKHLTVRFSKMEGIYGDDPSEYEINENYLRFFSKLKASSFHWENEPKFKPLNYSRNIMQDKMYDLKKAYFNCFFNSGHISIIPFYRSRDRFKPITFDHPKLILGGPAMESKAIKPNLVPAYIAERPKPFPYDESCYDELDYGCEYYEIDDGCESDNDFIDEIPDEIPEKKRSTKQFYKVEGDMFMDAFKHNSKHIISEATYLVDADLSCCGYSCPLILGCELYVLMKRGVINKDTKIWYKEFTEYMTYDTFNEIYEDSGVDRYFSMLSGFFAKTEYFGRWPEIRARISSMDAALFSNRKRYNVTKVEDTILDDLFYNIKQKGVGSYRHLGMVNIYNLIIGSCRFFVQKAISELLKDGHILTSIRTDSVGFKFNEDSKFNFKWPKYLTRRFRDESYKEHMMKNTTIRCTPANEILSAIDEEIMRITNKFQVVQGAPGTGKTYSVKGKNDNALCLAMQNKVAGGLDGTTFHRCFGINIGSSFEMFKRIIKVHSPIIRVDEFSMLSPLMVDILMCLAHFDKTIQILGDNNQLGPINDKHIDIGNELPGADIKELTKQYRMDQDYWEMVKTFNKTGDEKKSGIRIIEKPTSEFDRFICYRNSCRHIINKAIVRKRYPELFKNLAEKDLKSIKLPTGLRLTPTRSFGRQFIYKGDVYQVINDENDIITLENLEKNRQTVRILRKKLCYFDLGYAQTSHSCQGSTYDEKFCIVELDMMKRFAGKRSIYVALSRGHTKEQVAMTYWSKGIPESIWPTKSDSYETSIIKRIQRK